MSAESNSPEHIEKLLVDARARLVWGEHPDDVRNMLLDSGLEPQFVDNVMHTMQTKRGRSMRKRGMKDALLGAGIIVGTTVWALGFLAISLHAGDYWRPFFGLATISSFAFFYGWFLVYRGAERLVFGARADGADSDIED